MEQKCTLQGIAIVVVDRGFVYIGQVEADEAWCVMTKAKNIRVWGTTKGLGELVNGPTKDTKLDTVGTLRIPMRAVISIIDVSVDAWKTL